MSIQEHGQRTILKSGTKRASKNYTMTKYTEIIKNISLYPLRRLRDLKTLKLSLEVIHLIKTHQNSQNPFRIRLVFL